MKHDLVDRYRLWIFPVLLGGGKRLFARGTVPTALKLVVSEMSHTGVAMHTYERVGRPTAVRPVPPLTKREKTQRVTA